MADKYIFLDTTGFAEKEAITTSSGSADAGKIPALGADGKLSITMMPSGVGYESRTIIATENLSAGDLVNLWDNNSSTIYARKADASGGPSKRADGFVTSAVTSGNPVTVYLGGVITGLTGLTVGAEYWLSATPGGITLTMPTTPGYIAQKVGKALSTTELLFRPEPPTVKS